MSKPRCPAGSAGIECSHPFLCCRAVRVAGRGDGMGQGDGVAPAKPPASPWAMRDVTTRSRARFGHTFPAGLQGGWLMSRISIWMLALVASLSQPAVAADGVMYTCVDAKGARTYQNAPCPKSSATHGARSYVVPVGTPRLPQRLNRIARRSKRNAMAPLVVTRSADRRLGTPIPRSCAVGEPGHIGKPCCRRWASSAPTIC